MAPEDKCTTTNLEAKEIARGLGLDNRVEIMDKAEAFITLKDYKDRIENDQPGYVATWER